jgi:hypothetical protein
MLAGGPAQQGQGAGESFSAIGHSPILGTALADDLGSLLEFVVDNLGIRRKIGPSPATSRLRSRCVDGSLDLRKRFALGHQILDLRPLRFRGGQTLLQDGLGLHISMSRHKLVRLQGDDSLRGRDPAFRGTVLLGVDERVEPVNSVPGNRTGCIPQGPKRREGALALAAMRAGLLAGFT